MGVLTTPAHVNEISNMDKIPDIADLPEEIAIKADKRYQWAKNRDIRASRKLKNHIMKKAGRSHPLTRWEKKFNKIIGRNRFKAERSFGSIKR